MGDQRNRGLFAEELVRSVNRFYRHQGIAVVHKVPTQWKPLRRYDPAAGCSRIVTAKVDEKAAVDFLGVWNGRGIAFDVKENSGTYWPLSKLEPHQRDFLHDWQAAGGISFILIYNRPTDSMHLVLYDEYARRYEAGLARTGPTTIKAVELVAYPRCPEVPGCSCDYLAAYADALRRLSA